MASATDGPLQWVRWRRSELIAPRSWWADSEHPAN